ncbi:MAG: chorismate-binding protein [Spirochaetaceae bacterium]|nr:chorismate-binding protein [Spirochaetaceae bacterium]MDE0445135.1 chorismate-binding protein [Spirochaetaceae bacterium]
MSNTDVLLRTIPGERFTPYTLARKLNAKVLLESASFHRGRERYSILLLKPAFTIQERKGDITMTRDGRRFRLHSTGRDILDVLRYFADQHAEAAHAAPPGDAGAYVSRTSRLPVVRAHPFPFPVGGIGYLSYEYAAQFDTVRLHPKADSLDLPDAYFVFGHVFVVFDHYTDSLTLVGVNYREHRIDLEEALDETERRIDDLDFNFMAVSRSRPNATVCGSGDEEWYLDGVEFLRGEIIKGNLFQAVLSRRLVIETELPALEAYRSLRSSNPSPYMFYLDYGDFQLFGASPEVHVKVADGRAAMRPIAGTRRRGRDHREDVALQEELLADEKELAEHLMLVDLARNDLGRVAEAGSVEVTERNVIEHYSHVMHIVSQVEADLRPGLTGADAVRATFPAGTVSGAPKIQAMETLDALESETRGFYAGIVGYVEPGGTLDSCISIRSAVKKGGRLVLHAGAGVVYDSVPQSEFEETQNKLRALAAAVGVQL